jgi:hypothetical protein
MIAGTLSVLSILIACSSGVNNDLNFDINYSSFVFLLVMSLILSLPITVLFIPAIAAIASGYAFKEEPNEKSSICKYLGV